MQLSLFSDDDFDDFGDIDIEPLIIENTAPLVPDTIIRWRCPNCGQTLFTAPDDTPPDMCDYCQDMTTWERVSMSDDT